jgi:hypothetical protein
MVTRRRRDHYDLDAKPLCVPTSLCAGGINGFLQSSLKCLKGRPVGPLIQLYLRRPPLLPGASFPMSYAVTLL